MHFSSATASYSTRKVSGTTLLADGPSASPAVAAASRLGDQSPPPSRVLIVDDDKDMRQLCEDLMAGWGCEVDTADNGETGWKAICLSGYGYDLVITDHDMPRLTGLELIKRMRAASFDLPCLLVSGRLPGEKTTLARIIKPGSVLSKPFQPAVLLASAEKLLRVKMKNLLSEERPSGQT
jgi:DNA-binding response OmpR family regulator